MEQSNKLGTMRNDFIMFLKSMKSVNLRLAENVLNEQISYDEININTKNCSSEHITLADEKVSRNVRLYLCYLLMNEFDDKKSNHLMELQEEINRLLNIKSSGFNNRDIN
jgi:hypothetical protein